MLLGDRSTPNFLDKFLFYSERNISGKDFKCEIRYWLQAIEHNTSIDTSNATFLERIKSDMVICILNVHRFEICADQRSFYP